MTNSEISKKVHDLFSSNKFEDILIYLDDNVVVDSYSMGLQFRGKNEFMNFMMGFKNAFPDLKISHSNIFESGNWVCLEFTGKGNHTGTLQTPAGSIPATGKELNFTACETMEIKNGKICTIKNYQDSGNIMRQLGVIN